MKLRVTERSDDELTARHRANPLIFSIAIFLLIRPLGFQDPIRRVHPPGVRR